MNAEVRRTLLTVVAELAVVAALHAALLAWFAGGEVAAVLFTGGHAVSPALWVGALAFFATRLLLYLVLPGVILAQVVGLALPAAPLRDSPPAT